MFQMIRPHLETLLPIKVVNVRRPKTPSRSCIAVVDDLRQQTVQFKKQLKKQIKAAEEKKKSLQDRKKAYVLFKLTRLTAMH